MKSLCVGLLFLLLSRTVSCADKPPALCYLGEWSDGRGTVLLITANTWRMGSHLASYKEIARSKDLRSFRFHLISGASGFHGNYFNVEISREEMRMRGYQTLADCMDDKRASEVISWERDR